MDGKINSESFRDASFSYLRSTTTTTTTTTTVSARGAAEISVFGAERYFNSPLDHDQPHNSNNNSNHSDNKRRVSVGEEEELSVTACSDQGSRSTVLLLKSGGDDDRRHNQRRRRRWIFEGSRSFFSTFVCTGVCSDDKSIFVDEQRQVRQDHLDNNHHHSNRRLQFETRSTKRPEDHFAFPILNTTKQTPPEEKKKENEDNKDNNDDEPPRMSLEVFGSNNNNNNNLKIAGAVVDEVTANLERKLSVLTWDAIPTAKPFGGTRVSPKTTNNRPEDLDSDASSDLFEIENITSTPRNSSGYNYEPSEVSIEWSVVTASAAADIGGGSDQYDEKKISSRPTTTKRRPGINGMLGCKNQKSVRVVENASKTATSAKGDS